MIWDFFINILDYIIMFFVILAAVFLAVLGSLLVVLKAIIDNYANKMGYQYQAGRKEYMSEQEQSYRRKTV